MFEQGDRPFYVPDKDELLKYEDEFYYEKTKHNYNLENYLRDDLGLINYEEIVEDFAGTLIIYDNKPDEVIADLRNEQTKIQRLCKQRASREVLYAIHKFAKSYTKAHAQRSYSL